MAASGLIRERDLRALTAVVEDGLRDDPGPAMPWVVLDQLLQLIPCMEVTFNDMDLREQTPVTIQILDEDRDRDVACYVAKQNAVYPEYWMHRAHFLPSSYLDSSGDTASVVRDSDFYTLAALKNHPFYTEYLRHQMGTHSIMVPLPPRPGRVRRLIFARDSGPDFSERDRLVLQLLRPHLHEVYLDAERRRRGIPHLSRREREVLQLVAQGFSNADIARILFISPATVAKHMEHIFDRTGVRTRSAAAALALPSPQRLRPLHGE
jgi:DNA-binding CsgD family transcriptional regulator